MKIYIAGAISNNPNFKEQFKQAEDKLKQTGNIVLNPATLPTGLTQQDYMSICIPMLYCCDAIYLLKGWKNSIGANIEKKLAEQAKINIIYQ